MLRRYLFEWEDQAWLPAAIREGVTAYLQFAGSLFPQGYEAFSAALSEGLEATGATTLIDLCSGTGGPVPTLLGLLAERGITANAVLTDLHPHSSAWAAAAAKDPGRIAFVDAPVDARHPPTSLAGFRLICNGFHHFDRATATAILGEAVTERRGIAILEAVECRLPAFLTCAAATILVPLALPFIRPWRWERAALTLLLPLIPLATAWDGMVSCLRVYSPAELRQMVAAIPNHDAFHWRIDRQPVPGSPLGFTYLVGWPRESAVQPAARSKVQASCVADALQP